MRIIELKETVTASNDRDAEVLRGELKEKGTLLINLMASPGAGKTTLLERTIRDMKDRFEIAVMEADVDSDVDAVRIEKLGAKAVQAHTGGMCHMDAGMTRTAADETVDAKNSFTDPRLTLTEEQVKIETARCLGCGATIVDENKCIGCGLCTTRCEFDAIHLLRDHPQNSDMRRAEDKVGGLLSYAVKRAFKIVAHSGSEEAKMMRRKRKEYNRATKEFHKTHPHTGNGVDVEALMKD